MAPGRRRGAKGAKTKQLKLGDLVLAKVKGHPAWPAKIGRPEDWEKIPDPKKIFVHFFGTDEIAFVAPADIQEFTIEAKNKLAARCKGKTVKYFADAVKQICAAFEELQEKSSSGVGADTDKSDFGSEAPSAHSVPDDAGVTALEVKNAVDELHGEEVLEVPADHSFGLEGCSQRQGEMDSQDSKSKNREGTVVPSEPSWIVNHIKGLIASKDSSHSEAGRSSDGGGKDSSLPVPSSINPQYVDSGPKEATNGHNSKKIISGSRRKLQADNQVQKVNSSGADKSSLHGNSSDHANMLKSGEGRAWKRSGSSGIKEYSQDKSRSNLDIPSDKRKKQNLTDKVHPDRAEDLLDKKVTTTKKHDVADLSGRNSVTKSQIGHGKNNLVIDAASHPVKRSKSEDITLDNSKGSVQKNQNNGQLDNKSRSTEFRRSVLQGNVEDCFAPRDEEVFPPNKRRRQVPDIADGSSTRASDSKTGKGPVRKSDSFSDKAKSPAGQYPKKRRAVRLYDEDDDEPKTPVHGGHVRKVDAPLGVLGSVKNGPSKSGQATGILNDSVPLKVSLSTVKVLNESSMSSHKHVEVQNPIQALTHIPISHMNAESIMKSSEESKQLGLSPVQSPVSVSTRKPVVESLKANMLVGKTSDNISYRNSQSKSNKNMVVSPDCTNHSPSQGMRERNKSIALVERKKDTPKSSSRTNDSILLTDKTLDIISSGDRMDKDKEAAREDKMSVLLDAKIEDSSSSMKHLIAVAQAKRREAYSQSFFHGNSYSDVSGGSPNVVFAIPPIQPSSIIQPDTHGFHAQSTVPSPSSQIPRPSADNHPEIEEFEDLRYGSGQRAANDPLTGGTEAAVARDAFEGMIETLSRTKESIGRATRLAIDCAKYGIANEVVELLIHKLETESSFHRKVDLFFLVDSITQCSHSQKGIAGASYIPTVQSVLPRLLGAAAPPEAGARENRRQCLKVLRLWLERKILPESLLRKCMDDIGVSNDDSSAGAFSRRPSRAERAVDDPIREMEGMLVDEYGSNTTFQLPGFVTSHVFDDEDEEDEFQIPTCKEHAADISPVELTSTAEEAQKLTVDQNDRRHCILEDVDGELEMEDVSVHLKDEGASFEIVSKEEQGSDIILEADSNTYAQLPFPMGSPPSPPDSPPATPPLPTSPQPLSIPPPPPPSAPLSPPPPPPPPAQQAQPHPPPLVGILPYVAPQSSVIPQPSSLPQHLHPHPFQASVTSSSPNLAYQLQGTQLSQLAGSNPHGAHIDANIRNGMYIQPPSCYASSGVGNVHEPTGYNSGRPLDCGNTDQYINHQTAQPSQQFQPMPMSQRPFHPAPPSQAPSSQFSYSNSAVQQRPQHQYPQPYTLPSHPDGPRQYHTDDKWRMQSSEFSTNNPNGPWINGTRSSLVPPVPPFAHDVAGYFRPHLERPPLVPSSFQQSAVNAIPVVPPIPGQNGPQMMPCRPDMSSLSSWRPA
ncbi:hypothetical protein ACET3Z_029890 [Daucus carota]